MRIFFNYLFLFLKLWVWSTSGREIPASQRDCGVSVLQKQTALRNLLYLTLLSEQAWTRCRSALQLQWFCSSLILWFGKSCFQNCLFNSVSLVLFVCLCSCLLQTFRRQILLCTNISKRALINRSTETDVQMNVLVFDYIFLSVIMGIHFKSAIIPLHNVYLCPLAQLLFQTFEQILLSQFKRNYHTRKLYFLPSFLYMKFIITARIPSLNLQLYRLYKML